MTFSGIAVILSIWNSLTSPRGVNYKNSTYFPPSSDFLNVAIPVLRSNPGR